MPKYTVLENEFHLNLVTLHLQRNLFSKKYLMMKLPG